MTNEAWRLARERAARQDWLITAEQAYALGVLPSEMASRLRSRECHALLRGVYLCDPDLVSEPPARMLWRAALLAHGDDACLVAGSAARALGLQGSAMTEQVIEIGRPDGRSRSKRWVDAPGPFGHDAMPEVVVRQFAVPVEQTTRVDGLAVREAFYTVVDAALDLDRASALCVLDSALQLTLLSPEQLMAAVALAKGRPGVQRLRKLAELADGRAESPLESRIRLICIDGSVPPDDLQYPVYDDRRRRLIAVGDLGWHRGRARPLLAEADGKEPHERPAAVFRDRGRGNLLVVERCDTVRFVWADSFRPTYVLYVVRSALAA
ncbi:MAG: hypothetical protein QOJ03_193 [Frankiaceae bacterium]|nr:hypothetical protein [Frankiaceae bacterium]